MAKLDTHCPETQPPQGESRCLCLDWFPALVAPAHHKTLPRYPCPLEVSALVLFTVSRQCPQLKGHARELSSSVSPRIPQGRLRALIWQGGNWGKWKQSSHCQHPALDPPLPSGSASSQYIQYPTSLGFKSLPQLLGPSGQVVLFPSYSRGERRSHDLIKVKMVPSQGSAAASSIWPSCEDPGVGVGSGPEARPPIAGAEPRQ